MVIGIRQHFTRAFVISEILNHHRTAASNGPTKKLNRCETISAVGDVFTMNVNNATDRYEMINEVVEFVTNQRVAWAPTKCCPST